MPAIQPSELWLESNRWDQYGSLLLRMKDRHQRDYCFGPTHEEVITDLARRELKSHKQLPINFYKIQIFYFITSKRIKFYQIIYFISIFIF